MGIESFGGGIGNSCAHSPEILPKVAVSSLVVHLEVEMSNTIDAYSPMKDVGLCRRHENKICFLQCIQAVVFFYSYFYETDSFFCFAIAALDGLCQS